MKKNIEYYKDKPVEFLEDFLGIFLTNWQKKLLKNNDDNKSHDPDQVKYLMKHHLNIHPDEKYNFAELCEIAKKSNHYSQFSNIFLNYICEMLDDYLAKE